MVGFIDEATASGSVYFTLRRDETCAAAGSTVFHLHFSPELDSICIFIIA